MPSNRKPVYRGNKNDRRVISAPNGLWVPQRRIGVLGGCKRGHYWHKIPGTDAHLRQFGDAPHFDPWEDIHGPSNFDQACVSAFGRVEENKQ
jgi:hypothetical protein